MNKELKQIVKRLMRDGIVVKREQGNKHVMLTLANGARYASALSPSDWRGLKNMECEIKRLSKLKPAATLQSPV